MLHKVGEKSLEHWSFWIIVTLAHGYNFENWLDWPQCEDNWPGTFDKVGVVTYWGASWKVRKSKFSSSEFPKGQ